MAHPLLLGAVLTFATTDASQLALTVTLSEAAEIRLTWDGKDHAVEAKHHTFLGLPTPTTATVAYSLHTGDHELLTAIVASPFAAEQRLALYGDSRDGDGPHRLVVGAIQKAKPHVLIHTGDVVQSAGVEAQWVQHLSAVLPLSSHVPVILALGNHEVWYRGTAEFNALEDAMKKIPPPADAIAKKHRAGAATHHVRIGDTLVVSLDSNRPIGAGSAQESFLREVLDLHKDAKHRFVAMHHGARSSGRHGRHGSADALSAVMEANKVTASLAGHDHLYERIVEGDMTYFVSGGGGAPLYTKGHQEPGSRAFVSTYNWVMLFMGSNPRFEAYSLEGAVLDRDTLPAAVIKKNPATAPPKNSSKGKRLPIAAGLVTFGLVLVGWSILRRRY